MAKQANRLMIECDFYPDTPVKLKNISKEFLRE